MIESEIVKVRRGEKEKLSKQEKKSISYLPVTETPIKCGTEETAHLSFAQNVLKRRKFQKEKNTSD